MPSFADVQVVQSAAPRWPTLARARAELPRATAQDRERRQNEDRPHEIDGCSGGVAQDPTNYGGVYIPYIRGEQRYNQESTEFGTPQADVAHAELGSVLSLPCNKHDICYQTCGSDQAECDTQMLDDMRSVCETAYPEACPAEAMENDDCDDYADERQLCFKSATRMYKGLRAFGSRAHGKRQKQYCLESSPSQKPSQDED